jgi:hypothetical protein
MTRQEQVKDAEVSLSIAKERLVQAAVSRERAVREFNIAEAEHTKWAELLGRLAYGGAAPNGGDERHG